MKIYIMANMIEVVSDESVKIFKEISAQRFSTIEMILKENSLFIISESSATLYMLLNLIVDGTKKEIILL